jgi:hypothetical protein
VKRTLEEAGIAFAYLFALAQLEVERAERLVEQQHGGAVDERARQRDALLLAA